MMVDTISINYEGSINRFIGDCVLAFFGAPITHENDAERAILAALDIRDSVKELNLDVSIGINTGMTYVGEMGSDLIYSERSAWGPDVDFARRLQEAAGAGQIYVGASTYRLTRRAFDFDKVVEVEAKGVVGAAYPVLHVREHPEKLRGIEGLRARMIGREREFSDLKEAADLWLGGQGQIVSIVGEAGIGKSRLVSELREYLGERGGEKAGERGSEEASVAVSILEGRCVSIGQPISYWPFLDILRTYFRLSEEDDTSTIAHKVTESITNLMPQGADEMLPLLGNLLSIKYGNELDDRLKFAGPEQIRHQTLMRLRDIFETLARKQPLLLILEDLHWADDLSLDLVSLLMDELANTPLMLLCVYRPERDHRVWQLSDQARRKCLDRHTDITLNPLSSHQSRLLVESLLEIENLPEATKDVILRRSEGNPFFIEEVIRSLIDRDLVYRDGERWKARAEITDMDVPDTIQSVVLARVDRLQAEAKHVLQCASVIGRLFRYRLLQHISHQEQELDSYITEFEDKELIYEERTVPELEYAFKHAFTQEATYQGILERLRREFHHQVAVGIERLYQERLDEYYEELAHHYSRSDNVEKAAEYLLKAGQGAKMNYANDAAVQYLSELLLLIERHCIKRDDLRLDALWALGEVYMGGNPSEAIRLFEEAMELAEDMEIPARQYAKLCFWLIDALVWQDRHDECYRYAHKGLEALGDNTDCVEAVPLLVYLVSFLEGSVEKRPEFMQKALDIIDKVEYSPELRPSYILLSHYIRSSDPERSLDMLKALENRAEKSIDLRGVADAYEWQGSHLQRAGNYKEAIGLFDRGMELAKKIGDDKIIARCHMHIISLMVNSGDIEKASGRASVCTEMVYRIGRPFDISWHARTMGMLAMSRNKWDGAIEHYQKYVKLSQEIPGLGNIPRAKYLLGNAYLRKRDYESALELFDELAHSNISPLPNAVGAIEKLFMEQGECEKFSIYCDQLQESNADRLAESAFQQWYLTPAEPSKDYNVMLFSDGFASGKVNSLWTWTDKYGDCAYDNADSEGLCITSANGRDLFGINLSAPRLMRDISGGFAAEVSVSPASDDEPQMGGILIWKDRDSFLRFERGVYGQNEMRLHGYVYGKRQVAGRGLLQVEDDNEVHLRVERSGDEFTSYCSTDGENWLTCGKMILPMDDPIQVGIHAIGMIDRTIYCGAYKEGTATVFRNFRIWTRG
jgi:tetratricopeptide (TPR) repeat protein/regulation of enolase protein 1 (concanavalin A-like superfamily)